MLKNLIILLAFSLNLNYICLAQQPEDKQNRAEAIQAAYLTKELGLSKEEAQRFWPIFNNYKEELRKARQERTDEIEFEERVLNIRKKYKP